MLFKSVFVLAGFLELSVWTIDSLMIYFFFLTFDFNIGNEQCSILVLITIHC